MANKRVLSEQIVRHALKQESSMRMSAKGRAINEATNKARTQPVRRNNVPAAGHISEPKGHIAYQGVFRCSAVAIRLSAPMWFVGAILSLCVVPCTQQARAVEPYWHPTTNGCLIWNELPQSDEAFTWSGPCIDGKAGGSGTEVDRYRVNGVWMEERYTGEMQGGKRHGHGTQIYENGDRFEGGFENNKRVGKGIYIHANGDRYEGDFENDERTGLGTFTYLDGTYYRGEFVKGNFDGHGVFTFANGNQYDGAFKRGLPNGYGTYKTTAGQMISGRWVDGCYRQGNQVAAVGTSKDKCGFK